VKITTGQSGETGGIRANRKVVRREMDNNQFNINGRGTVMLEAAIKLALMQRDCYTSEPTFDQRPLTAAGYMIHPKKGLVLLWHVDSTNSTHVKFLTPHTADMIAKLAIVWLSSPEAKNIELDGWDCNTDHDGHNSLGWRVYCEDWGRVAGQYEAIVAIKPAYIWYGK
jgi:hypothetical protein